MPGPPPAAGVVDGADFVLLLVELVLLAAAGVVAAVLLLIELLLDEPLADLLTPLCPRQAPFVVLTDCVVPSLHVTVMLPLDDDDEVLLLIALELLAAAGAAAEVLLLLELLLDEPLADLLTPLCPRQAPFVVVTDCVVPSLHVTVMLPLDAAACACAPGAAMITAAAITAINPNDFIEIPSALIAPMRQAPYPNKALSRRVACMTTTLPSALFLQRLRWQLCLKTRAADVSPGNFLRH
jgi:hypothetical protein